MFDLSKHPPWLAETITEVIPQLAGGSDTFHLAWKLIADLYMYIYCFDSHPPEDILKLSLPPHMRLVALAREQPWKLRAAVDEYVVNKCDIDSLDCYFDGEFDPVIDRLVAEAMELAEGHSDT